MCENFEIDCPICKDEFKIDEVYGSGTQEVVCPHCNAIISVRIRFEINRMVTKNGKTIFVD